VTNKLKIRVEDRGQGDATIHLPPLPPDMDGEHDIIFHDGDRVVFGLMIYRYEDGHVGIEVFDPDISDPVLEHEFKENNGEEEA